MYTEAMKINSRLLRMLSENMILISLQLRKHVTWRRPLSYNTGTATKQFILTLLYPKTEN